MLKPFSTVVVVTTSITIVYVGLCVYIKIVKKVDFNNLCVSKVYKSVCRLLSYYRNRVPNRLNLGPV